MSRIALLALVLTLLSAWASADDSSKFEFETWFGQVQINGLPYECHLQNTTADGSFTFLFIPCESDPAWDELAGTADEAVYEPVHHRKFHVGFAGGDENGSEEWRDPPLY